jgi:hypothetical protein
MTFPFLEMTSGFDPQRISGAMAALHQLLGDE